MQKTWRIKDTSDRSLYEKLLRSRNVEEGAAFFQSSFSDLSDPFLFSQMEQALERVGQAIENQERIVIFGDYDVDGVTGTAILVRTLSKLGAQVSYRLPHRVQDGYGLKKYFVDQLLEKDVKVIITVDNGISAKEAVDYAQEKGIDVIITDHHSIPAELPNAYARLHPKCEDETFPFEHLSGSGVAYMFSFCLLATFGKEGDDVFWQNMVDLAAMGTVADCVPLIGDNRTIVQLGLKQLKKTTYPGLDYLMNMGEIDREKISSDTIGFFIGPRLNAGGRMDTAIDSLHLFLQGEDTVKPTADKLHRLNIERQVETRKIAEEIEEYLADKQPTSIVIAEGDWHIGIIGIVAARLSEKYHLPSIVLGRKGDEYVASCRSEGVSSVIDILRRFGHFFTHFGGHEGAGGFSIHQDQYGLFRETAITHLQAQRVLAPKQPTLEIETLIDPMDITFDTCDIIARFEPFGEGNRKPLWAMEDCVIKDMKLVGSTGDHLKLTLQKGQRTLEAMAFSKKEWIKDYEKGQVVHVAFELEKNEFRGEKKVSLIVRDMRAS